MSLSEQNRMLYILHRNKVSRINIEKIMTDLNKNGIFNDFIDDSDDDNDDNDDWRLLEEECDIFFSDKSREEKIREIRDIKNKKEEDEKFKMSLYCEEKEKRINQKIEELIKEGIIESDAEKLIKVANEEVSSRYGRSPLHEAISMRNIPLIEKYLKRGKYLDIVDNNGHTPLEMAFYENNEEALDLFKKYKI